MWPTLEEADESEREFYLPVYRKNNGLMDHEDTDICVRVVPSQMTVKDLKKQFCDQVIF